MTLTFLERTDGVSADRKPDVRRHNVRRRMRLLTPLLPAIVIGLIVVLLGLLLWFDDRDEREEQRLALIKDALWVEQALRFHLATIEGNLQSLANNLGHPGVEPGLVSVHSEHLIRNEPGVIRVTRRNTDLSAIETIPPTDALHSVIQSAESEATTIARQSAKPAYSSLTAAADGGNAFAIVVPVYENGRFSGSIAATVSLSEALADQVPWWVAERHRVSFVDEFGTIVVSKSGVQTEELGLNYKLALDPPVSGLYISVAPYRNKTGLIHNTLVGAILVLAALACLSLYAVHRHTLRRIRAETALRSEHAFRKAMEDSLTVGMRARDLQGRVIYVNPAFCRMVDWPAEELIGRDPPMPYWVPEHMERTMAAHLAVLEGLSPPGGFEIKFQRRNGEHFDALIYEAPLIDADGRHAGWMGSVLDITDRKRAEELSRQQAEKLSRTSRLITVGEMASTLAHELNQPLSAIAGYATGGLNRIESGEFDGEEAATLLKKLATQARRAGTIIRRIHDFVRKREPKFGPVDPAVLLHDTAGFIGSVARVQGVELIVQPEPDLPIIRGDRILLEQALLNLVRNGFEAMANMPRESRAMTMSARRRDDAIEISIADRGLGIADEVAALLFTPFVSTKPDGMGMGLNICRSIVELHKGRLWCEPRQDRGTAFIFTIPLAQA
jgi:two-component system, LuxR family, sensor histidine kinase DctS